MTLSNINVLVVGSINMDCTVQVEHLPNRGETIHGSNTSFAHGGKGANQAVAAARMEQTTAIIAAVGSDKHGQVLTNALSAEGIDTTGVNIVDGESGSAIITVEQSGENTIVVIPAANEQLTAAHLITHEHLFQKASVVLVQLEIPIHVVEKALQLGKHHKCLTILNPAPAQKLNNAILSNVDICTPNETEAAAMTQKPNPHDAAHLLYKQGIRHVIVTLGEQGAFYVSSLGEQHFPAPQVQAVDTTAAGDAFNGTLAAYIAAGADIQKAIPCAIQAASLSVTKRGAQPSLPQLADIQRYTSTSSV